MLRQQRPRIAVVAGYMPFFDEIMPEGHPSTRFDFGAIVADFLRGVADVTYLGLVSDHSTGEAQGEELRKLAPDAVLLVPTMATPAGYFWRVLQANPDVPVVILAAHEVETIEADYDMVALCRLSSNVGAMMIGNVLTREGRPFQVVVGPRDRPDTRHRLCEAMLVASLAGQLRSVRIGKLGDALDGYVNVAVDATALQKATGIQVIDIAQADWERQCESVTDRDVDALGELLGQTMLIEDRGEPAQVRSALRVAAALNALNRSHGFAAGAINCRGPFGVKNPKIDSLGCLATTVATSRGVPFTCTADVITAVAMLVGKRLGGAALYCELDAIDEVRDAFLCANTGEGDMDWCGAQRCKAFTSGSSSGRFAPGCSVRQVLRPGPATMIGFTPCADDVSGFTFIALEGEVQDPPELALTVTAAWFQAKRSPMRAAMEEWIRAGATHHGALCPGHLAGQIQTLARYLRVGCRVIGQQ
jgi:L-arabinose isomerase